MYNNIIGKLQKKVIYMDKWCSVVKKMNLLTSKYNKARKTEKRNVHQTIVLRSLIVLKMVYPETEKFYAPMLKTMMQYAKRPDRKTDYENGKGYHYYCACSPDGKRLPRINGYYMNGKGETAKSARTMLEEDYTMAITMYRTGFNEKSAEFLGRAVHMLSDICCLPHSSGMTYFSKKRNVHKAYEALAEAIYPEFVPQQKTNALPPYFLIHSDFEKSVNRIVEKSMKEIPFFIDDPFRHISQQLNDTEIYTASLLLRFYQDTLLPEDEVYFVSTSSKCRIFPKSDPLSVQVTKNGIIFHGLNPSPDSKINVTLKAFYVAHRRDGLFTLSPASEKKDCVLEVSGDKVKLAKFNPANSQQLFRMI